MRSGLHMTLPLTERQEQVWRYIRSCERSPTFEEMRNQFGLSSRSSVFRIVQCLKAKGYVRHRYGDRRGIVAIDPLESPSLDRVSTDELLTELVRRGIIERMVSQ